MALPLGEDDIIIGIGVQLTLVALLSFLVIRFFIIMVLIFVVCFDESLMFVEMD